MDFDNLTKNLQNYYDKLKTSSASVSDWTDMKNKIRQAYDAGTLNPEQYSELNKKTTFHFKNQGRAFEDLKDLPEMVRAKSVANAASESKGLSNVLKEGSRVGKLATTLAPLAKALAIGGTIAGAMGAGQKAMAGDLPGAALDATDTATDLVPGVGEAKMALRTEGLGAGSDNTSNVKPFDLSPYAVDKDGNHFKKYNKLKEKLQSGS